jgi:hypothetical protein
MNKKSIYIVWTVMLFSLTIKAQCGWINGSDSRVPQDPGRGVQDRAAHANYASKAANVANADSLNFKRMEMLKACLPADRYARLYADVSVIIAGYGTRFAGWLNKSDNSATDQLRGVLNWNDHYNWATSNGGSQSSANILNRLAMLRYKMQSNPDPTAAFMYADVSVKIAEYGVGSSAPKKCSWIDGGDNSITMDNGRGVSDRTAHLNWAKDPNNLNLISQFITSRLESLKLCLPIDVYSRVYGDISQIIASYGVRNAGWVNGSDNSAGSDGGRGIYDFKPHYSWSMSNGGAQVSVFIKNRLEILKVKIPRAEYAKLYADLSVAIAEYGRNN